MIVSHHGGGALDSLAVDQRVAFTLCVLDERTSREAAAILGVNEITVRTRITRAREKLYVSHHGNPSPLLPPSPDRR